jgi:DNA invertase Pin-like site-specific DNA recombinase
MTRPKKIAFDRGDAKRAVIYVRVSTDEQKKGFGPEVQEQHGRTYCARRGYTVEAVYEDLAVSGTTPWATRAGLSAAMRLCLDGAADTIVASAQDRFARKAGVWDEIHDAARAGGFRLEATQTGQVLTDQENELTSDAMAFVASIERKLIVRRLRSGREGRAGVDGRGSSSVPYGYVRDHQDRVIVNEAAVAPIRLLLRLREEGASYPATARALNEAGHRAPQGGLWRAGQVYAVEQRAELYRTGRRRWDGIEAAVTWPILA